MSRLKSILPAVLIMVLTILAADSAYAAKYNYPYPTAENKKGLALGADMEEDALELNVCHATINFPISLFIAHEHSARIFISSRGRKSPSSSS